MDWFFFFLFEFYVIFERKNALKFNNCKSKHCEIKSVCVPHYPKLSNDILTMSQSSWPQDLWTCFFPNQLSSCRCLLCCQLTIREGQFQRKIIIFQHVKINYFASTLPFTYDILFQGLSLLLQIPGIRTKYSIHCKNYYSGSISCTLSAPLTFSILASFMWWNTFCSWKALLNLQELN